MHNVAMVILIAYIRSDTFAIQNATIDGSES